MIIQTWKGDPSEWKLYLTDHLACRQWLGHQHQHLDELTQCALCRVAESNTRVRCTPAVTVKGIVVVGHDDSPAHARSMGTVSGSRCDSAVTTCSPWVIPAVVCLPSQCKSVKNQCPTKWFSRQVRAVVLPLNMHRRISNRIAESERNPLRDGLGQSGWYSEL